MAHQCVVFQRTGAAQPAVEVRQKFIKEKRNSIAKRPAPVPAKDEQTNTVIFAPTRKVIVRRNSGKFDAAVGDDYSIICVVIKAICSLVHSQLERIQLGMSESPGAQPDFLTIEVKALRRRDIGIVRCLCA